MSQKCKLESAWFQNLLEWYGENKRELPWRGIDNGYYVWISEIMLQQTRVSAVIEYYKRFLNTFPTVESLAEAKEEELLKVWEGLGYYSRVRNMQKTAFIIQNEYDGSFPTSYDILIHLPGIGPYTAGAVSSIAGLEKHPAVDGNVLRIITRVTGDDSNISKPATVKAIQNELKEIMDNSDFNPGEFNQAMMELGATVCIPNGQPKCQECPWNSYCVAKRENLISGLPVKDKGKERRIEEKTLLLLKSSRGIALHKRPSKGLLAGMYEMPSVEGHLSKEEALKYVSKLGYHPIKIQETEPAKHIFSHVEWHMTAYLIWVDEVSDEIIRDTINDYFFVNEDDLKDKYPLPSAFDGFRKYLLS